MFLASNKENLTNCGNVVCTDALSKRENIESRCINSQKDATLQEIMLSEQIGKKLYRQRRNNKMLFDKIRSEFSFFDYELRPPVRMNEHSSVMIREYDKLLSERQFLQRELTKIEDKFSAVSRVSSHGYNFLIDAWKSKGTNKNSQEAIDRLNKIVILMKQGIDTCVRREREQKNNCSDQIDRNGEDTMSMSGQLLEAERVLENMKSKFAIQEQQQREEIRELKEENVSLKDLVKFLEEKNRAFQKSESELFEKINKLGIKILQQDKKIEQLKGVRDMTTKYISKEVDENNCPSFQILVKSKSIASDRVAGGRVKLEAIYIDKSLKQIEQFLKKAERNCIDDFQIISSGSKEGRCFGQRLSQHLADEDCLSVESEVDKSREIFYSSIKKPRRNRELYSALKTKQALISNQVVKQMLFIRRK